MDKTTIGRITTPKMVTADQNMKTTQRLQRDWMLGPEKASPKPGANPEYWAEMVAPRERPAASSARTANTSKTPPR